MRADRKRKNSDSFICVNLRHLRHLRAIPVLFLILHSAFCRACGCLVPSGATCPRNFLNRDIREIGEISRPFPWKLSASACFAYFAVYLCPRISGSRIRNSAFSILHSAFPAPHHSITPLRLVPASSLHPSSFILQPFISAIG